MNSWRDLLNKKTDAKSAPSIIDEAVTGVAGNSDSPNNLFYSEFSESDAESFFAIFKKYKENSFTSQTNGIILLQNNLMEQINSMPKNICPIEILLYSANSISSQIYSNADLFAMLKKLVAKMLQRYDSRKVVWYILSGWEWLCSVSILIEAMGDVNNEQLVKLAMNYYPSLAELAAETNDKYIFKAYLNMLFDTQNVNYLNYIVDVVSNKNFNDNELIEYFLKMAEKNKSFTSSPEIYNELVKELSFRDISAIFRAKISLSQKKKENRDSSSGKRTINVKELSFGRNCYSDLFACKNCNDSSKFKEICEKIMDSIDDISPKSLRGEAYILLGTKGKQCSSKIIEFLYDELENHSGFTPQINAALFSLDAIGPKELYNSILEMSINDEDALKNIGGFFRYRSLDFAGSFLPFVSSQIINDAGNEKLLYNCATKLERLLSTYNGKEGKLGKDVSASNEICKILYLYNGVYSNSDIYNSILDVVDLVSICSSQISKILKYLDVLRDALSNEAKYKTIVSRVNSLIKKLDTITPGK